MRQLKDDVLADLARTSNVAQFLSVRADSPEKLRHLWVRGMVGERVSIEIAVRHLVRESVDSMVNVRTFSEISSKGGEFLMGLKNVDEVLAAVSKFTKAGISVIVNESIDIHDGGVSGVWFGDSIEFAPDDTPRCVEKAGVCRLPRKMGEEIIQTIYGVTLPVGFERQDRVEFSVHPRRHGVQHSQFIIWEVERQQAVDVERNPQISWPNRFSQHIGDKTFGLLIANSLGYNVPRSTVISRRVRPFTFGKSTGTNEFWYRTSPRRQLPGKLPTVLGHQDLFTFLDSVEEKDRDALASVLVQESVDSKFSGGAALRRSGAPVVEGVIGHGDEFMLGKSSPTSLPKDVFANVQKVLIDLATSLGPSRMEWVFDGNKVWIVQLHVGAISSDPIRIVEGNPDRWIDFHVREGLESLRQLLAESNLEGTGIRIFGDVGVTSHFGDLLRGYGIPSVIIKEPVS